MYIDRKIHIICVAYDRDISLRGLIDCFLLQTNPNWVLYIIYDGKAPKKVNDIISLYSDDRIIFNESPRRFGQYGHPNRKRMLDRLASCDDFVLMTNDDNYYVPRYVEFMLREVDEGVGIIYCDTIHSHAQYNINYSELRENYIDIGAFMVRLDVAKKVGFNHVCFSADGKYAEECNKYCIDNNLKTVHVPKALFVHN